MMLTLAACGRDQAPAETASAPAAAPEQPFEVSVDRFADVAVLRYEVPGFDELSLSEKKLAYYLSQAALAGRDIIYDQNYEHNLRIRKLLSAVVSTYSGDRDSDDFRNLVEYAKRVWFAHGIHHHYSMDKMLPVFSPEALIKMVAQSDPSKLPLDEGQTRGELLDALRPVLFDPDVAAKKVTLDPDVDQVVNSATNFYDGVTAAEVEQYYATKSNEDPARPISWGLNSQLAKVDGEVVERVWKIGGVYGPAIEQIVHWLEKASTVAERSTRSTGLSKCTATRSDTAVHGSRSYPFATSRPPSGSRRSARMHSGLKTTRPSWINTRRATLSVFRPRSSLSSCRAAT
jgi:dipeptidyl-peptidase-3